MNLTCHIAEVDVDTPIESLLDQTMSEEVAQVYRLFYSFGYASDEIATAFNNSVGCHIRCEAQEVR